jgi:hypothetical protein
MTGRSILFDNNLKEIYGPNPATLARISVCIYLKSRFWGIPADPRGAFHQLLKLNEKMMVGK